MTNSIPWRPCPPCAVFASRRFPAGLHLLAQGNGASIYRKECQEKNTPAATTDSVAFSDIRSHFRAWQPGANHCPWPSEIFLCACACSKHLSELSTGYGKFGYTREGVSHFTGICPSQKTGQACMLALELSLQPRDSSITRNPPGSLSDCSWQCKL
jgi:hypothetical protein